MRKISILVIACLFIVSIPLFDINSNANSVSIDQIEEAQSLREVYGFNTSERYIRELFNDKKSTMVAGIPFTIDEINEMRFRDEVYNELSNIEKLARKGNISNFGGVYFNAKDGTARVKLVDLDSSISNFVVKNTRLPQSVIFENAVYSLDELNNASNILTDNLDIVEKLDIQAWYVSIKDNKLVINVKRELLDDEITTLNSIIDLNIASLNILETSPALYETQLRSKQDKLYGGVILSSSVGVCSAGFHARDNAGNNVLVTAGHCDDIGSTRFWHHHTNTTANRIGTWDRRTSGNTAADAGYIRLSNNALATERVYPNVPIFRLGSGSSEYQGMPMCRIGQRTGQRCGELVGTASVPYNHSGYGTVSLQRVTSAICDEGDSGGTAFRIFYGSDGSQQYELLGITTNKLHDPNSGVIFGSTYSHVSYVLSGLGLSPSNVLLK